MCPEDKWYRDKDIVMDHINPVVCPIRGFTGFDDYIDRMFAYEDGWQRLCEIHHDNKTSLENEIRKLNKQDIPKSRKKRKKT